MDGDIINSTQAGAILGVSGKTVVRLGLAGKLPIVGKLTGPNGAYLFRRADVERLLKNAA